MSNRTTEIPGTATGVDKTAWRAAQAALDIIEAEQDDPECRLEAGRGVSRLLNSGILSRLQDT